MAFEVRALVVHSILWASSPIPHWMQQCSFPSLCWTKDLLPDYPRIKNALWKHLTLNRLYHACRCYLKRLTLMQNDQQHCWTHILSTISLETLIPSAFWISPLTSVLTQTTANITDARHCNPGPSSLILTLLNMDTPSKARILPILFIPRHQNLS
jgi:hypothetical protein